VGITATPVVIKTITGRTPVMSRTGMVAIREIMETPTRDLSTAIGGIKHVMKFHHGSEMKMQKEGVEWIQ